MRRVYIADDTSTGDVVVVKRQLYHSTEAAKELAFAKVLASNPSALVSSRQWQVTCSKPFIFDI